MIDLKKLCIRPETPADYRAVESLIRDAFWNLYVPGCDEHYVAHALRGHADFIPALDLVAELDGQIVGSVMYTKATLMDEADVCKEILTFGPLAVLPACQRQGVGKALLDASFKIARTMGYDAIVIFGHPGNYVARGFKSCQKYSVCMPDGSFPTAMLVKELTAGALDGRRWIYHESPAYAVDPDGFSAFDAQFPPRPREYRPSQEEFYIYSHSVIR